MERIGIYSGTFDPVHEGHIAFAKKSYKKNHLDRVVFLPEANPRGKNNVTDISHRIELIKRTIKDDSKFDVRLVQSKQFTVDETFDELKSLFPNSHFTFLFGSDIVKALRWDGIERILSTSDLSIGLRHDDNEKDVTTLLENLKSHYGIAFEYTLISTAHREMTSSHIRQGMKQSTELSSDVSTYIRDNNLYNK